MHNNAYIQGKESFRLGVCKNPYSILIEKVKHDLWSQGWHDASEAYTKLTDFWKEKQ